MTDDRRQLRGRNSHDDAGRRACVRGPAAWLAIVMGCTVASVTTAASQVCVICDQPSAVYNCRIADDPLGKPVGDRVAQFACVTELAKAGNHASCRVRRDFVPGCDAPERVVSFKGALPGGVTAPGEPARVEPNGKAPTVAEGPPQTMAEVARRAAVASKDGMKKAGDAVGDTARDAGTALQTTGSAIAKGVTCLFTLFLVCGEKPAKSP
jgi:hypothetical protein